MQRVNRAVSLALLLLVACEPLVDVNLKIIEPCDQSGRALSGVETYEISHDGPGEGNRVVLTAAGAKDPLYMRELAEDVVVSVRAFEGDAQVDDGVLSGDPQAIGRSMPLDIARGTQDMDVVVPVGLLDGFGQTTSATGECKLSDNGTDVEGRHALSATFLANINKVLIAGGAVWTELNGVRGESFLKSAELFDPATGEFEALPEMPTARGYHTATALPDGRVFVAGGFGVVASEIIALTSAIIYDPSAPLDDPWTDTINLNQQRALHTATLLEAQQVVVLVGGCTGAGCTPAGTQNTGDGDPTGPQRMMYPVQVYDIVNDRIEAADGVLATARALHAASALEGGRMLISGGVNAAGPVCTVEVLEASDGSVVPVPPPGTVTFSSCPANHAQLTLAQNRVIFIGGQTAAPGGVPQGPGVATVQVWNTLTGIQTLTSSMLTGRHSHGAALLPSGELLVVGGAIPEGGAAVERLVPSGESFTAEAVKEPLASARARSAVEALPNGQTFVLGGYDSERTTSAEAHYYFGE